MGRASRMMTTRIWIEPVKRPDGRNWYTDRGLLWRSRLGGPEGEILCDRVHNPVCESCRVLMSRGIVGPFETWKAGIPYPCMTGDIAKTAELTVHEPDDAWSILRGGDPLLRMPFPALRSRHQRARRIGAVGGSRRSDRSFLRGRSAIVRRTLGRSPQRGEHETEHIACSDGATLRTG